MWKQPLLICSLVAVGLIIGCQSTTLVVPKEPGLHPSVGGPAPQTIESITQPLRDIIRSSVVIVKTNRPPKLGSLGLTNFTFQWNGTPRWYYRVDRTTNMPPTGGWTFWTNVWSSNNIFEVSDYAIGTRDNFYRVTNTWLYK